MPVGDFSAADYCTPIAVALRRMFAEELTANQSTKAPLNFMKTIAENHGMKGYLQGANKALTYNAFWTQDCDVDTTVVAGTTFDATVDCDLPAGVEDGGEVQAYTPNVFVHSTRFYNDQNSENHLFGINRSAERIFSGIKAVRKQISDDWAAFMSTNAQVNAYAGIGTINGTTTEFGAADFTSDLLYHWELIATQNQINKIQVVNGKNLWELGRQAANGACCGDQSDRNAFGEFDVVWDPWLDTSLGTDSSFVFDPRAVGFFNFTKYNNVAPERLHGTAIGAAAPSASATWPAIGEIFKWKVDDPDLKWLQLSENGQATLIPVSYDIEYKKECVERDPLGFVKYKHTFFVHFSGGRFLAPAGCNGNTHILEMVNTG